MGLLAKTAKFPYPSFDIQPWKLNALLEFAESARWFYLFGGKLDPIGSQPNTPTGIDCSGWTRACIWDSCRYLVVDGSADQHDQAHKLGLKVSDVASCLLKDGIIRWFFLAPVYNPDGSLREAGHTGFVVNGQTIESYGGHGPGSRAFDTSEHPWMANLFVFVLSVQGTPLAG